MYLNKVFILGNLTRDPELRSLPSGRAVTSFGVATNRVWRDQSGNKQDQTEFHNIVAFGRQAEIASQYLKKGSSVLVEGRLQTRSWDDQSGAKRYRTEIVADRIQLGPRSARGGEQGDNRRPPADSEAPKEEKLDTIEYPAEDVNPEDIPF
ncbi:MAG: single-stranded DNA-binding protein [Parcubacteria group bacterium]|nr:single-stranded DNA-binding protein [Parcubacteria group bacterium]